MGTGRVVGRMELFGCQGTGVWVVWIVKYIIAYNNVCVKGFSKKSFLHYTNSYLLEKAIAKARDFSFRTVKNLLFMVEGNDKGVYEFVVCGRLCTFVFVQ